ncbi:hypothetical protein BphiR2919_00080 [Acinetobacter phage Bphi-R2919]|nr:hypothetical protein BphiR2919_00080 [Acinetobacter phage Bphi-R2919]
MAKKQKSPKLNLETRQLRDFENWLIDKGADIVAIKNKGESIRFIFDGRCGLIYNTMRANPLGTQLAKVFLITKK